MAARTADVIPLLGRAPRIAPEHPSLRWIAGDAYWLAHRRDRATGRPSCGATGALVLAIEAVPLCLACFPASAAAGSSTGSSTGTDGRA